MIIEKDGKYYLVEREITKEEIQKRKKKIKEQYEAFVNNFEKEVKEFRDERNIKKAKMKVEFDELNNLK